MCISPKGYTHLHCAAGWRSPAFGPVSTAFGNITIKIRKEGRKAVVQWKGKWHSKEPRIEVRFPESEPIQVSKNKRRIEAQLI